MIELYEYPLSERSYPVRMLLAQLELEFKIQAVEEFPDGQHRRPAFMALSPTGVLPVVVDGDITVWSSNACLVYLATRHDALSQWYPKDAGLAAQVQQWLSVAATLDETLGRVRRQAVFGEYCGDVDERKTHAAFLLGALERHLWHATQRGQQWLCGVEPTVADLACFGALVLSDQSGVSLMDFPSIRRWCERTRRMPKFVGMPGVY